MSTKTLQRYIKKMQRLQRGEKSKEGPAPHKPILLLSVIDLFTKKIINENKIAVSPDLVETFKKYWIRLTDRTLNFAMPFFHLKNDKFWHLHPNIGKEDQLKKVRRIRKFSDLLELVEFASLDRELFDLLNDPPYREEIRQTLINTYFPDSKQEIQALDAEEEQIGEYGQLLLEQVEVQPFSYLEHVEPINEENPIRSAAFRREIMKIYNYTCAVCRLRIVTLDGESATEAAHIIPFKISQNDDVRNGICLCRLHHWAFDKGLISLSKNYKVLISPLMSDRTPTEWMLTAHQDNTILLPNHHLLNPAQDALAWHRKEVFRE